ncbi:hypothetical protein BDQ17DRAFT_1544097 [Cyathus striatus]|nr:hypothetical protein BDQ17DRAFT_1544097 [Cyathus striatus]
MFLDSELGSSCIRVGNPQTFVRTVTQVSSYWRALAHSTPQLWTSFHVDIYERFPTKKKMDIMGPFVEKCLTLSAEMPLDFMFKSIYSPEVLGDNCVKALAQSASRWRNASIENGELLEAIATKSSLSIIRNLKISSSATHLTVDDIEESGAQISFQSLPSLKHLTFKMIRNPFSVFSNMPWSQIKYLSLNNNDFALDELYHMLNGMTDLVSLIYEGPTMLSQTVTIPSLQVLELSKEDTDALDVFNAPSLKRLKLDYNSDSEDILDYMSLDKSWTIEELRQLKKLNLHCPPDLYNDIRILTKKNVDPIFPQLATLKIYTDGEDDEAEDLVPMLKSRLPPAGQADAGESATFEGEAYYLNQLMPATHWE